MGLSFEVWMIDFDYGESQKISLMIEISIQED